MLVTGWLGSHSRVVLDYLINVMMILPKKKKKNMQKPDVGRPRGTCHYCKQPGHWAMRCYKRIADEKRREEQANNVEQAFASGMNASPISDAWYVDSGASQHMSPKREWFVGFQPIPARRVFMGDNSFKEAIGVASIVVSMVLDSGVVNGTLESVLYVPVLVRNLLSVSKATSRGLHVDFTGEECILRNKLGAIVAKGKREERSYKLLTTKRPEVECAQISHGVELRKSGSRHEIVHSDLCGPMRSESLGGARNRNLTTAVDGVILEEAWSKTKPLVEHLQVFGCVAYAHVLKELRGKLDSKSQKRMFVGCCGESKAYRLYDIKSGKIMKSRNVVFNEASKLEEIAKDGEVTHEEGMVSRDLEEPSVMGSGPTIETPSTSGVQEGSAESEHDEEMREEEDAPQPPRRPQRKKRTPTDWWKSTSEVALIENNDEELSFACGDRQQWETATGKEYKSLVDNETWVLTELPKERKTIGCKLLFRIKRNAGGSVDRYKARLVAKGYAQIEKIDFGETFAPVAKFTSIRTLFTVGATEDMKIHQMDVKTTFLNGDLDEEIYMEQSEGYKSPGEEHLASKLQKSFHGLKQAPRAWYHFGSSRV